MKAILYREIKKQLFSPVKIFGVLIYPMLIFLLLSGTGANIKIYQVNYYKFLLPSFIVSSVILISFIFGEDILNDISSKFIRNFIIVPHSIEKLIFFKIISDAIITAVIIFVINLILLKNIYLSSVITVFCLLISIGYTSFSILLATIMKNPIKYQIMFSVIVIPMIIVSGGIFPLEWYDNRLKTLALFNPVSYNIDFIRALLLQPHNFSRICSFFISLAASLIMLLMCLLFSKYFKINI